MKASCALRRCLLHFSVAVYLSYAFVSAHGQDNQPTSYRPSPAVQDNARAPDAHISVATQESVHPEDFRGKLPRLLKSVEAVRGIDETVWSWPAPSTNSVRDNLQLDVTGGVIFEHSFQ